MPEFTPQDSYFLNRAFQLAQLAGNQTSPNPLVGAVCVADGKIIGEGFHAQPGNPHAEPEAIYSVKEINLLRKSTLYVTLEPCNHFGKTPPCSELIIQSGIPRVVIGCLDPSAKVNGAGIKRLQDSGIEVILAPDSKPFEYLIRHFTWAEANNFAWLTLKWAESQHGYIGDTYNRIQISHTEASVRVHKLRSQYPAILVGANTVLVDTPKLNTRLVAGHNPIKIILDPEGLVPVSHPSLHFSDKTLHLTGNRFPKSFFQDTRELLRWIYQEQQINAVLVEGGAFVHNWFIQQNCWNEIYRIQSQVVTESMKNPVMAPDCSTLPAPDFQQVLGKDLLFHYSQQED